MSTYVLMRILESSPRRYDLGMRLLTFGRIGKAYDRLAVYIEDGQRVLDIGCGTGALSLRAARRGATVKGIDINTEMLEIARQQLARSGLTDKVELVEMGVAELDQEPAQSYDAVTCGLCFSELSSDEIRYTLQQLTRILKPGGLLLLADELRPQGLVRRVLHSLLRIPMVAVSYLITQQTTHPTSGLVATLQAEGFEIVSRRLNTLGSFGEFVARYPGARP